MKNITKILVVFFIFSLAFNVVLSINTKKEFKRKDEQYESMIEEKEKAIETLEGELEQANAKVSENLTTNSEDISKTEIDIQNQYKDVATQFIQAYLEYSVQNKGERRTNLLKMTDKKIVDILAPETEDLGDPNFQSSINKMSIYIQKGTDISEKCNLIVDVNYTIKGSENGETTLRSLVEVTIEKQKNGMKVVNYNTYSAN